MENQEINSKMWSQIVELMIDNFDRMEMQTPSNFDKIVEFVYWDIYNGKNRVDWVDTEVNWSFKKWIESQS